MTDPITELAREIAAIGAAHSPYPMRAVDEIAARLREKLKQVGTLTETYNKGMDRLPDSRVGEEVMPDFIEAMKAAKEQADKVRSFGRFAWLITAGGISMIVWTNAPIWVSVSAVAVGSYFAGRSAAGAAFLSIFGEEKVWVEK